MPDARAKAKIMAVDFMAVPYFPYSYQNRPRTSVIGVTFWSFLGTKAGLAQRPELR